LGQLNLAEIDRHPDDEAPVRRLGAATPPASGWADTTAGRVVTVTGDPRTGQLAAIEFRDLERAETTNRSSSESVSDGSPARPATSSRAACSRTCGLRRTA
jgi:hypothetical protein